MIEKYTIAFGLSGGLALANLYISAFDVVPADTRASAVALINFAGYLASGFAPVFTGLWKQSIGIHRMPSNSSLLLVAAALVLLPGSNFSFLPTTSGSTEVRSALFFVLMAGRKGQTGAAGISLRHCWRYNSA